MAASASASSSGAGSRPSAASRAASYKSRQQFRQEDLRRRREEAQVEIRRQARSEHTAKRRNLESAAGTLTDGDTTEDEEAVDAALELDNSPAAVNAIVEELRHGGPEKQTNSIVKLRKLLSKEKDPPIDIIIAAGGVPLLVEYLRSPSEILQFESAWALTNIASGTSAHTDVVIYSGAIPLFINLLASSGSPEVREQAIWALGNIAGDKPASRDFVLENGMLPPLLNLLATELKISMLRNAVWALSNLCRGRQPPPPWEAVVPAIPALARLLYIDDDETTIDAVWALSYLSDGDNMQIAAVLESGCCPRLIALLGSRNPMVVTPTLRAVGNIVTGDDSQTEVAINAGCIPAFGRLLHAGNGTTQKEACWAISNIAAGSPAQVQALIDANIFPPLINLMTTGELRTRKEACWAISNATKSGLQRPELIRYLVRQGCIGPLCSMLESKDNQTIQVTLDALANILKVGQTDKDAAGFGAKNVYAGYVEECGGMVQIHQLQQHPNNSIYKMCFMMIDAFFPDDEEDELAESTGEAPPVMGEAAFSFRTDLSAPSGGFNFSMNNDSTMS
ncbi:Importin subunit alpha-1 [Tilletia horrida]|uniref:Importin subunit alpha n=1 Tax=Tilletia horrida TaxID=155126 RepID=A0AAN6JYX4_9BASI|nr:Importin subunit alpha-1 [Tilletia horrida]KAK0553615.1 Importin subunit alpha-1 [Tilletia horrida]KAK0567535.1 Importin subunit alpha-1 [Tilletia horrida]